ncbi:isochorismatase family protein [Bacillus sp. 1P06AnD]|uniref:isochorismatase family protein n=1 Tax=Bacillus sp. 1P06AnD TaxID=3132208 RepID=UPI0039A039D5
MKQALLIIDSQQDLIDGSNGEKGVFAKEKLIQNINLVIEKAVHNQIPIICIRDVDVSGGEGPGFQLHKGIKVPSEVVLFDKAATNSFYGTPLNAYLQHKGIEHLVIMGCQTEYCIDTAVRTATINQFDVTLIADGHSTCDSPILTAEQIIHHHNHILHGHYNVDHFSLVRDAAEDVFVPTHHIYR